MANTPPLATRLGRIGRSVYSQLVHRLKKHNGPIYPLHVGDTYLSPASYIQDLPKEPQLSRYSQVRGDPKILQTVAHYLSTQQGQNVQSDELILTHGATEGLTALLASLISPGDEVLILAPYWPLVAGSVRLFGGVAKEGGGAQSESDDKPADTPQHGSRAATRWREAHQLSES